MSVFQNVAFGLQVQGVDKLNLKDRVAASLQYMHLQGMEKRYPQEISGGQQQRVALARMLVSRPSIFLMDEPLSNLDARLRMEMRAEIKRIHRESQATTVYVTHDQIEALTLSTRVAVMEKGVLQQVGSPKEIYRQPANLFVADFIGSPTINFIPGRIVREAGGVFLEAEDFSLSMPFKDFSDENYHAENLIGKEVIAAIRPEDIRISEKEEKSAISGRVYSILPAGADVTVQVKRGDLTFSIREKGEVSLAVGDKTYLQFSIKAMLFYDQEKGTLLFPRP
jgi:multiple sugar transport system ATP-binding protein